MEEEKRTIVFPCDYKGKALDKIIIKLKAFLFFFLVGAGLFAAGLLVLLLADKAKGVPGQEAGYGIILMCVGFFLLVISPVVSIAMGMNRPCQKEMRFELTRKQEGVYFFKLDSFDKEGPRSTDGFFNLIKVHRRYAEVQDNKGHAFYFPFKAMKEEDAAYLKRMGEEYKKRAKEHKQKKRG